MGSQSEVFYDKSLNRNQRITLLERFLQPVALNAVIALPGSDSTSPTAAAFAAYTIANKNFEILGTNAVTGDCPLNTAGGVTPTAHSTTNDITVVLPHLDSNQTSWTSTLWDTTKSPTFEAGIKTSSSVAAQVLYHGFKLTNTPTIATDDDQAYFSFDTGASASATRWVYNYSIAGTDFAYVVPDQVCPIVAASTYYKLRIEVYSDRTHMAFINDIPISGVRFGALTSLTTLIPYNGVKSLTTAAKTFNLKYLECSRLV